MAAAKPLLLQIAERRGVLVDPRFRVNRKNEEGGNNIIEWTLAAGDRSRSSLGSQGDVPWHAGETISVDLRWAKDSPTIPSESTGAMLGQIRGLVAHFERTGTWSLLAFLDRARAPAEDLLNREDPSGSNEIAVKLQVRTKPNGTTEAVDPSQVQLPTARVFLSVLLRKPKENEAAGDGGAFLLPVLPTVAPAYEGGRGLSSGLGRADELSTRGARRMMTVEPAADRDLLDWTPPNRNSDDGLPPPEQRTPIPLTRPADVAR
jgi:hypothetical protein